MPEPSYWGQWGQLAHLCLSRPDCSAPVSSLRVKARRKQAATRPEGVDDEDPVMGTVAWVSDAGVFSGRGGPRHVHSADSG